MYAMLETLRSRGLRRTAGRTAILALFNQGCSPLTADEVVAELDRAGTPIHRTTVYRELHTLTREGMLQELDLGAGARRYESAASHHHHVHCTSCGRVTAIEGADALEALERTIAKRLGFTRLSHTLEFAGLCRSCTAHAA